MREFDTGAKRDAADWKHDYKGFLSMKFVRALGSYMHFHRRQADGGLRASDNWKLGIPLEVYEESLFRHAVEFFAALEDAKDRAGPGYDRTQALTLALAMGFNLQGWIHETVKAAEAQGIDVNGLVAAQAQTIKDREAAHTSPITPEGVILARAEAERQRKAAGRLGATMLYDPAAKVQEDYVGPGRSHGPQPAEHHEPHDPHVDRSLQRPFDLPRAVGRNPLAAGSWWPLTGSL